MLTRSSRNSGATGFGRSMGRSRRNENVDEGLAAQYAEPLVAGEDLETGQRNMSADLSAP